MIRELVIVESAGTDVHFNQAVEASLLETVSPTSLILYIWANDRTVVIGKNQNAFSECNIPVLREAGGVLARRISGGGAVYHDKGNLNFTFLCAKENYSLIDNFKVVLSAVRSFNINAELSGRNDLTIEEKKFSGNAFYTSGNNYFHHGTILINTMSAEIAKYLNVSTTKLASKGVKSVVSRVTNLLEHNSSITYDGFSHALKQAFISHWSSKLGEADEKLGGVEKLGGMEAREMEETREVEGAREVAVRHMGIDEISEEVLSRWVRFFSDEAWVLGDDIGYNFRLEKRFEWGLADIRVEIRALRVERVKIYTDSLNLDIAEREKALIGRLLIDESDFISSDILKSLKDKVLGLIST